MPGAAQGLANQEIKAVVSEGGPVGAQEGVLEGLPGALGAIRQAVGDTELPPFSHYQLM